jgi:hypothetical protein
MVLLSSCAAKGPVFPAPKPSPVATAVAAYASRFDFFIDADVCLHPPEGLFDPNVLFEHDSALRRRLLPEYRPGMVLSLVVQPSFEGPYLVYMEAIEPRDEPRRYRVVVRRVRGDAIDELNATLDGKTGRLIRRAWEGVVARTQYPREVLTAPDGSSVGFSKADGAEYHFWASGRGGVTHSPERGSLLDDFVGLAETLGTFVSAPKPQRASVQRALHDEARDLLTRIDRNEPCVKPYHALHP